MKLHVFAVYDRAAGAYLPPFFVRSKAEAIRMFTESVQDGKSPFSKFPSDYTLCGLGYYDDVSGAFSTDDHGVESVIRATECIDSAGGNVVPLGGKKGE